MTTPRIAMVSYHTCPAQPPGSGKVGGMNVYVRELARNLGALGVGVDVFTRRHPGCGAEPPTDAPGVRVVHLPAGEPGLEVKNLYPFVHPFAVAMLEYQRSQRIQYAAVHSHYWLSAVAGRYLARANGAPHVVTFHTLAELKRRARAGEGEPLFRGRIEGDIMKSARWVTASTAHEVDAMAQMYGAPTDRVKRIQGGVDLSMFQPLDAAASRRSLGLNGESMALYVGRIEPLKGVEFLLRIIAAMDRDLPFRAIIVGGDPSEEEEARRMAALSRELGLGDVVRFEGRVDRDRLAAYFSAADVCVVPSYYESFGLVALESMACGTPVVAARVGGLPSIIDHGRNGYLLPRRCPERFADVLTMVILNSGLRESMGRAALKMAGNMSWRQCARDFAVLYGIPVAD